MATGSAARAVTNTLTTTTADVITLTSIYPAVDITNHDATNALYFRVDGATAVGAADDCGVVMPGGSKVVAVSGNASKQIVVSVVGSGNVYTIEGVNQPSAAERRRAHEICHSPIVVVLAGGGSGNGFPLTGDVSAGGHSITNVDQIETTVTNGVVGVLAPNTVGVNVGGLGFYAYDEPGPTTGVVVVNTELQVMDDVQAGENSRDGTQGLVLWSPDGTKFRVTVSNLGVLQVAAV